MPENQNLTAERPARGAPLLVMGVESSCDETAVALYHGDRGLLAQKVYTQTDLHEIWGGVVPELASRDHVRRLLPMIATVMREGGAAAADVQGIAYTAGPGLIGALLVGSLVGVSLAAAWGIPAVGVHHLEGHLLAPRLEPNPPEFPYLALLVSGGHTMIVDVRGIGRYEVLGESLDDAVGEAFDKTAKLLGLSYPGGAKLAQLAEQGRPGIYRFPRPMLDRPGYDFSFSGLKTAALLAMKSAGQDLRAQADLARGFEDAVVETLVTKVERALAATGRRVVVVAGGVGANRRLRQSLAEMAERRGARAAYPRPEYCTDNAAMIAYAGHARLSAGECTTDGPIARARWSLTDLRPPAV